MERTYKTQQMWDRMVLLLAWYPREGWKDIYEEIGRREVARLAVPTEQWDGDE